MFEYLAEIFTFANILMMNIGMAAGIIIGALPGLSALLAVTLVLPFTFGMSSLPGMYLMLGTYCGATYGGSITAILINTPGTPNAACTTIDGYPLALKKRAGDALNAALFASTVGGLISAAALFFLAPALARFALNFGAPEYFALCVFGLVIVVTLIGDSIIKSSIMALIGLLISTVGIDTISATPRFMFGNPALLAGVQTVALMLGVFAISEIMVQCSVSHEAEDATVRYSKAHMGARYFIRYWKTMLRSALIGIGIGCVPGTGGAIAAFISYSTTKKLSKHPEKFGNGSIEGVLAPETSNNAVTGAALIPLLTLGIPGDACMAVFYGALIMQGITPGPSLFTEDKYWVYCIMIGFFIVNLIMWLQGKVFSKAFANVTKVPFCVLVPCIMVFCLLGAYSIRNLFFDVAIMLLFGIIGYFLKKCGFAIPPLAIGLVLGTLTESNLRRTITLSGGHDLSIIFHRPIALIVLIISLLILVLAIVQKARKQNEKIMPEVADD